MKIFFGLTVTLLLSSCTTFPDRGTYLENLSKFDSSEREFSELIYDVLALDKTLEFELGGNQQVFAVNSGNTFYKAFILPKFEEEMELDFRVRFNTPFQKEGHVPLPTIIILDSYFKELAKHSISIILVESISLIFIFIQKFYHKTVQIKI